MREPGMRRSRSRVVANSPGGEHRSARPNEAGRAARSLWPHRTKLDSNPVRSRRAASTSSRASTTLGTSSSPSGLLQREARSPKANTGKQVAVNSHRCDPFPQAMARTQTGMDMRDITTNSCVIMLGRVQSSISDPAGSAWMRPATASRTGLNRPHQLWSSNRSSLTQPLNAGCRPAVHRNEARTRSSHSSAENPVRTTNPRGCCQGQSRIGRPALDA